MATISLRAYYQEIESMIERGRTKDAVAHCRQILKFYPKSIDTYRLLGKAYLEAQRFSEGADVLQRVLSAVPDDFISQIGMSIIREDEGNLDAALWHMERAFEAQPSNVAVQDELRRLYGRRDGIQPAKIRLTRGALVRMYARGELYQQAIAEARIALVEQPDRVDLELILAKMYYLSNQKKSATDTCTRLLEKLPFCYEANKILTDILPGSAREDEVKIYQQRLISLDPYLAFIPKDATSVAEAPDDSVMVESLELAGDQEEGEHPEWGGGEEEKLPEWLAALETRDRLPDELTQLIDKGSQSFGAGETTLEPSPTEDLIPNEDDQIPTWMKAAGWQPAESDQEEAAIRYDEVADELTSDAEIPDWLQSIAPAEETSSLFDTGEPAESEEDTRWLESILTGETENSDQLEVPESESVIEESPFFEKIGESDLGVPTGDEMPPTEGLAEEISMAEPEPEAGELDSVPEIFETAEHEEGVPDWLAGMATIDTEPVETTAEMDEFSSDTDWLKTLATNGETPAEEEPDAEAVGTEPFEMERPAEIDLGVPDMETEGGFSPSEEIIPGNLLSQDDFLSEIEKALPIEPGATEPTRIQPPVFEVEPGEVDLLIGEEEELSLEEPLIPEISTGELEDLTLELQETLVADENETNLPEIGDLEIPDWLQESLDKEVEEIQQGIEEESVIEEIVGETEFIAEEPEVSLEEVESAAWLADLTDRLGETGEPLTATVEDQVEQFQDLAEIEPAEEVRELDELSELDLSGEEAEVIPAADAEEFAEPLLGEVEEEFDESISAEVEEEITEIISAEKEESFKLPDWLMEDLTEPESLEAEAEINESELPSKEELEWVNEEETPIEPLIQGIDEAVAEAETVTDYQEPVDAHEEEVPQIEAEIVEELEPAESEFLTEEIAEEVEVEEVPEWLMALAEDNEPQSEPVTAVEEVIPEWLKDLEEEPAEGTFMEQPTEPVLEETSGTSDWLSEVEETPAASDMEDTSPVRVIPPVSEIMASESSDLYAAQAALNTHDVDTALVYYNQLISRGEALEDTIHDLREALDHYPVDISLWQALGDAYMRSNQLQEALDAYTEAEELMR